MGWKLNDDTVKTKSTAIPTSSLVYLTNVRERERSMIREWITLWPVGPKRGFAWVTDKRKTKDTIIKVYNILIKSRNWFRGEI